MRIDAERLRLTETSRPCLLRMRLRLAGSIPRRFEFASLHVVMVLEVLLGTAQDVRLPSVGTEKDLALLNDDEFAIPRHV